MRRAEGEVTDRCEPMHVAAADSKCADGSHDVMSDSQSVASFLKHEASQGVVELVAQHELAKKLTALMVSEKLCESVSGLKRGMEMRAKTLLSLEGFCKYSTIPSLTSIRMPTPEQEQ